jgi:hypothetical protein
MLFATQPVGVSLSPKVGIVYWLGGVHGGSRRVVVQHWTR